VTALYLYDDARARAFDSLARVDLAAASRRAVTALVADATS
jgi:hypothetical protein